MWHRFIRRGLTCVVCGLVLTIAAAWAIAAWSPYSTNFRIRVGPEHRWPFTPETGWPVSANAVTSSGGFGFDNDTTETWPGLGKSVKPSHSMSVTRCGIPFRALCTISASTSSSSTGAGGSTTTTVHSRGALDEGLPTPGWLRAERNLPLRPVWPGFIGNTLVFALACWGVLYARGTVRRFVRRRSGLCLACGHLLAGLATCPECGTPGPPPPAASPPPEPPEPRSSTILP